MSVSEIHHAAITVSNLEKSAAFYQQILGFKRTLEMPIIDADTIRIMGLPEAAKGQSLYLQGPTRIGQLELIQWSVTPETPVAPLRAPSPGVFLLSFETSAEEIDRDRSDPDQGQLPTQAQCS
jgi:lactoylglutathione lyase